MRPIESMQPEELAFERERGFLLPLDNDEDDAVAEEPKAKKLVRRSYTTSASWTSLSASSSHGVRSGSASMLSSVLACRKADVTRATLSRGLELIERRRAEVAGAVVPASAFYVDEETAELLATRAPMSLALFGAVYRLGDASVARRMPDSHESKSATMLWDTASEETRERLFRTQRLREESRIIRLQSSKGSLRTPVSEHLTQCADPSASRYPLPFMPCAHPARRSPSAPRPPSRARPPTTAPPQSPTTAPLQSPSRARPPTPRSRYQGLLNEGAHIPGSNGWWKEIRGAGDSPTKRRSGSRS